MKKPIEHIILDFGDVLNYHLKAQEERDALVRGAEMKPVNFFERYWRHRGRYDLGELDADQYWNLVLDDPSPSRISSLRAIDIQGAVRLNPAMWQWTRQLKAAGKVLTVLSNMPYDLARYHEKSSLQDTFHHIFFSCDVGLAKPDPRIFQLVIKKTCMLPSRTLFIDDAPSNVEAALAAGCEAMRFESIIQIANLLPQRYDLPSPRGQFALSSDVV